jgi:hypothetical protein
MEILDLKCVLIIDLKKMILTQPFYGWGLPYWAFLAHPYFVLFSGYEQSDLGGRNGI